MSQKFHYFFSTWIRQINATHLLTKIVMIPVCDWQLAAALVQCSPLSPCPPSLSVCMWRLFTKLSAFPGFIAANEKKKKKKSMGLQLWPVATRKLIVCVWGFSNEVTTIYYSFQSITVLEKWQMLSTSSRYIFNNFTKTKKKQHLHEGPQQLHSSCAETHTHRRTSPCLCFTSSFWFSFLPRSFNTVRLTWNVMPIHS